MEEMGKVYDIKTGKRIDDVARLALGAARPVVYAPAPPERYSSDDRINAAAAAVAHTDEVYAILEQGVHLEVNLGELHVREEEMLAVLSPVEQGRAIEAARANEK